MRENETLFEKKRKFLSADFHSVVNEGSITTWEGNYVIRPNGVHFQDLETTGFLCSEVIKTRKHFLLVSRKNKLI